VHAPVSRHEKGNENENKKGRGPGLYIPGPEEQSSYNGDDDNCQDQIACYIRNQTKKGICGVTDKPKTEGGKDAIDNEFNINRHLKENKTPEEQKVVETERFFYNAPLAEPVDQQRFQSCPKVVIPVLCLSQEDHGRKQIETPEENGQGDDKTRRENQAAYAHYPFPP
jgi:hypothetical protein